ncbi:MAG: CPBP family intramembrane glutamic endopeptidase [Chitinophagaceae bacterium]
MAGIIVELIISWLLLWLICKKHISVLGFGPTKSRVTNLGVGLLIAASCCILYQLMTTAFINNSWVWNKQVTGKTILESSRWTLVSVLYEELIFRGALLYIAIKKIGVAKACILSAVGFGIYHWFTFNAFGNPFMMVISFLMTGFVGLSWAFAFAKTNSLYLPIGLHFGWNWFYTVVFSNQPPGQAILVRTNENQLQGTLSLLVFLFQVFALPLFTFWYLNRLSKKRKLRIDKEQQPLTKALPIVGPDE